MSAFEDEMSALKALSGIVPPAEFPVSRNATQEEAVMPAPEVITPSEVDPAPSVETPPPPAQDEPDDEAEEAPVVMFTPDQKPVNFKVERPISEAWVGEFPALQDVLAVFREAHGNVTAASQNYAEHLERLAEAEKALNVALLKRGRELTDQDGDYWYRVYSDALSHAQLDDVGRKATERQAGDWRQYLDVEGTKLRMGRPVQRLAGGSHSTDEIISYVSRKTKTGANVDIPLFHSGLWFRLRPAGLRELTALQTELSQVRVSLGAMSKSLAFSNANQVLLSLAADFVLQYVIDANVNFRTPADLKPLLLSTDIPSLLLGMAGTMFPEGFPYAAPCVADMLNCNYVVREKLKLDTLQWVDTNAMTREQRRHMLTRFSTKYTEEQIKAYQAQNQYGQAKTIWFDEIGLQLTVPTLDEQEIAGRAWIDGIIEMTQGAFNEPPHGVNRNKYIFQLGEATTARQYAHFVSAVLERDEDGERVITDNTEAIAGILNNIFSDGKYADEFFNKVTDYSDSTLISLVALPSYNCPACDTPTATKFHERFEHLVPLDALTVFFTLANRKLNTALQ